MDQARIEIFDKSFFLKRELKVSFFLIAGWLFPTKKGAWESLGVSSQSEIVLIYGFVCPTFDRSKDKINHLV